MEKKKRLYFPSDVGASSPRSKVSCGNSAVSRGIVGSVGISKVNMAKEAAGGEIQAGKRQIKKPLIHKIAALDVPGPDDL